MGKIKTSFTKVLPFAIIFCIVLMAVGGIAERLSNMVIINTGNISGSAWTGIMLFFKMAVPAALSPLYAGFYKFCFERVNGGKPHILTVFDFYRSAVRILKAVIAVNLGAIASRAFFTVMSLTFFNVPVRAGFASLFIHLALSWIIMVFFLCMPYLYAQNKDIGIGAVLKLSFKLGLKYIIIFIAVSLVTTLPEILYTVASFTVQPGEMLFTDYLSLMGAGFGIGRTLMWFIQNVFAVWVEFTAVYCIFERERNNMLKDFFAKLKKGNGGEKVQEIAEDLQGTQDLQDTPFIEPYDFCIEADERFHDEKIIEVYDNEDIRNIDILAALEEMNLAFDIVNHFGIRRKLKKMYDDLAFDIGEYVSYQDGKTVENEFTEEIDDRVFAVSVMISRSSNYAPFIIDVRIDLEED